VITADYIFSKNGAVIIKKFNQLFATVKDFEALMESLENSGFEHIESSYSSSVYGRKGN
jgi:hypothetical protein